MQRPSLTPGALLAAPGHSQRPERPKDFVNEWDKSARASGTAVPASPHSRLLEGRSGSLGASSRDAGAVLTTPARGKELRSFEVQPESSNGSFTSSVESTPEKGGGGAAVSPSLARMPSLARRSVESTPERSGSLSGGGIPRPKPSPTKEERVSTATDRSQSRISGAFFGRKKT